MFSREILKEAAKAGAHEVSSAFSKLSGKKVNVATAAAEVVSYDFIANSLGETDSKSIITYAQVIEGVDGVVILTIGREDTLVLVDLLNQQEVGTTGILMDLDRSAVKETLNILSNSYLNALAKITGKTLMIGLPYLMPASHVGEIFRKFKNRSVEKNGEMLLFKTILEITEYKIGVQLHIIFDKELVKEIKAIK